ncbi:HK97 gp10 family phage protein [Halobacillus sp. KGW1]|uniref:HK97 gp10 family phage protein n=1 Tax=Halobacillus sp. KGW1 TaxID=1793726 RepID=UPI001F196B0F|nr:HK97 gp10 family phage protein [Halobacillus sp. KGW1]
MDIGKEIAQALSEYTDEVKEGLQEAQKKTAGETAQRLRKTSPVGATGDYAKGWAAKKTKDGYVVHNRTDYQLTHLLEKGHAKVNGGRVGGIPHIRPAEEEAIDAFTQRTEKVIRG